MEEKERVRERESARNRARANESIGKIHWFGNDFEKTPQVHVCALKEFVAREGVSTKSHVVSSPMSVSEKASTVRSASSSSFAGAGGFSLDEISSTPPQYLGSRVRVVGHGLVGESAPRSCVVKNEVNRAGRNTGRSFVRNMAKVSSEN